MINDNDQRMTPDFSEKYILYQFHNMKSIFIFLCVISASICQEKNLTETDKYLKPLLSIEILFIWHGNILQVRSIKKI